MNLFHQKNRLLPAFLIVTTGLFLLSCATPSTDTRKLDFSAFATYPLPVDVNVTLVMEPGPRARILHITEMDLYSTKKQLREGWAITDAARRVMDKAFSSVVVDEVTDETQMVVKLRGTTKIDTFWLTYDVVANAQFFLSDGTRLASFEGRSKIAGNAGGSERSLRDAYIKAFQSMTEKILQDSQMAALFSQGFSNNLALNRGAVEQQLGFSLPVIEEEMDESETTIAAAPLTTPEPQRAAEPQKLFPAASLELNYFKGEARPRDIAVIIGNADYNQSGKDIPDVVPAHADAEEFKKYVTTSLGIREGNIIDLRDASQADLVTVFGSGVSHEGKLFNWVQPNVSNVVVYYAGHGAPGEESAAYIVPVDADPATLHLNGYPLDQLYANLAAIPAKSVTVVLEACFSGASAGGTVISNASPVFLKAKIPAIPTGLTVISAGRAEQMASWEENKSHGLFTKFYLKGMSGEADAKPYGNGDGRIDHPELEKYLKDTLTYYARRYYGRDQTAVFAIGTGN